MRLVILDRISYLGFKTGPKNIPSNDNMPPKLSKRHEIYTNLTYLTLPHAGFYFMDQKTKK